ncbi:MAG: hypothetical protein OEY49_07550 [Candidatus Heimdallarchaeota archaeon]|nr:hypothetical protein [Candidatus Heimdallarchaeota archaeon]
MELYDENGVYLDGATGTSYPDTTYVDNAPNLIYIIVWSYSGTGDFVLTISEGVPITPAYLGNNYGSLPTSNSEVVFEFSATIGETYDFSLVGPSGTDFDMELYDENGYYLDGATGTSYPDNAHVQSAPATIYIVVWSFSGTGDFTLNIAVGVAIDRLEYYGFNQGETLDWTITDQYTDSTGTYAESVSLTVEVLTSNPVDRWGTTDSLFEITVRDEAGDILESGVEEDVFPFISPISMVFEDGTSLGIEQLLNTMLGDFGTFNCNGVTCEVTRSESQGSVSVSITIRFDQSSGILLLYELSISNSASSESESIRIEFDGDINQYREEETTTDDGGFSIPFNPYTGIFFLVLLPLVRLNKRKQLN